ncbi:MAG: SGNH hydrolase domain-containing protein, partial [Chloroflexota bacterium]|nr:SGNH hydrolase domain-containing protein [Chloroflexota bacterium]
MDHRTDGGPTIWSAARIPRPAKAARLAVPAALAVAAALALVLVGLLAVPAIAADRDGDGLRDHWEERWGVTDPDRRDSDGDGVVDSVEDLDHDHLGNLGEQRFGTDPADPDSDGDGILDGNEDSDGDGRRDAREQDQRPVPRDLRPTLAQAQADHPVDKARCVESDTGSHLRRCVFGDADSETRIVLMGDSHALMWLPAFRRSVEQEGWRLTTLIKGGCTPALRTRTLGQHGIDRGRSCRQWRSKAIVWLSDHPQDLIVIAHSDGYPLVDSKGKRLPKREALKLWRKGMEATLAALPDPSKALLLGDGPRNDEHAPKCLMQHRSNMSACTPRRLSRSKRIVETALREAALAQGAQHRTLYRVVCTYDPCPVVHDDVMVWRDRSHLTKTLSRRLTPSIRRMLRDAIADAEAIDVRPS